jgi:hypothetical protein
VVCDDLLPCADRYDRHGEQDDIFIFEPLVVAGQGRQPVHASRVLVVEEEQHDGLLILADVQPHSPVTRRRQGKIRRHLADVRLVHHVIHKTSKEVSDAGIKTRPNENA